MPRNYHPPVPASGAGALQPREFDYNELSAQGRICLRDYLHILVKRKGWILGVLLAVVLLTTVVVFLMTPIYRATGLLQITQDNAITQFGEKDPWGGLNGSQELSKFQETQVKILGSRSLAWRIIEALHLADHADFKHLKEKEPQIQPQKLKSNLIEIFQKKLEIKPLQDSYLVEVSFKTADQDLAQRVTNAMAREYVQLAIDRRSESFSLVKDWLERQLQHLADKVQVSQKKLYEFGQKSDFFALNNKDNVIIQKYIELNGLLTKGQSDRMAKEAQYRQISEEGPDAPLITNNPLILALRQEVVAQNAKVASLQKIYLPGHPEMQAEAAKLRALRRRLQGEVSRIQEAVKADYEAAQRTEDLLMEAFNAQKGRMVNLQNDMVNYQILKRDAQTTEQLYQALLTRMKETTVASTMVASNVAIIDPADLPVEPYFPKKLLFLGLASVIGLFLGLGAAFVAEYLDDSLKTTEEVERVCQLPSLGLVPLVQANGQANTKNRGLAQQNSFNFLSQLPLLKIHSQELAMIEGEGTDLVVLTQPRSIVSEAIRHIRTSIMLSASGGPPAAILVTSPNPHEGKSTIASNLAASLAMDGRRVVLLDCDLRKPRLHRIFRLASQPGLTNYLTGNADKKELLKPTQVPNLWFVPAGPVPPSPAELLSSDAFKNLLEDLRQEFQHIIIDTPPALGFADPRVVSVLVDGVLLVIKHQSTPRESGRLACQLFSRVHAHVLGIILNQVNSNGFGRYDYCYHPKYYHAYYGKSEDEYISDPNQDGGNVSNFG